MVTEESDLRELILEIVTSKGVSPTHTTEMYDYVESQEKSGRFRFDRGDLSPISASNSQPKWKRNVRNGYKTLKTVKEEIAHVGRELYSLPREPPDGYLIDPANAWIQSCFKANYHLENNVKLDTSYNGNSYWVRSVGREGISISKCADASLEEPPTTESLAGSIVTRFFEKDTIIQAIKNLNNAGGVGYWGTLTGNRKWESEVIISLNPRIALDGDVVKAIRNKNIEYPEFEFNPDMEDHRSKIQTEEFVREGQEEFRTSLLDAYNYQCAISCCNVVGALDAAHITRYLGVKSNHLQNGIILRKDIHALFDRHLITIHPETLIVMVDESIIDSEYGKFDGDRIHPPIDSRLRPSSKALSQNFELFQKS